MWLASCCKMVTVAVIGAGFLGTSVSLHLLQEHGKSGRVQVTMIADKFSPDTTSDRSTALTLPFDVIPPTEGGSVDGVGDPSDWLRDTISHIRSLHDSPEGGRMGISLIQGVRALADKPPSEIPWWSQDAYGYKTLSSKECASYKLPPEYCWAASFGTYVVDCRLYLPQLLEKIRGLGGKIIDKKIESISELSSDYDIIVNCSGLGAAKLISDLSVYPVRGDIVSVEAPWIKQFTILESGGKITSVIPRPNDVLLGVTAIPHEWSTEQSQETTETIIKNCVELVPSLKNAKVLTTWAGLRPMRPKIRLCIDSSFKESIVVHCYGHGSKGGCYHWGCAVEVGKLLHDIITERSNPK